MIFWPINPTAPVRIIPLLIRNMAANSIRSAHAAGVPKERVGEILGVKPEQKVLQDEES